MFSFRNKIFPLFLCQNKVFLYFRQVFFEAKQNSWGRRKLFRHKLCPPLAIFLTNALQCILRLWATWYLWQCLPARCLSPGRYLQISVVIIAVTARPRPSQGPHWVFADEAIHHRGPDKISSKHDQWDKVRSQHTPTAWLRTNYQCANLKKESCWSLGVFSLLIMLDNLWNVFESSPVILRRSPKYMN